MANKGMGERKRRGWEKRGGRWRRTGKERKREKDGEGKESQMIFQNLRFKHRMVTFQLKPGTWLS